MIVEPRHFDQYVVKILGSGGLTTRKKVPPAWIPDLERQPPSVLPDSGAHTGPDERPASPTLPAGAETGAGQVDGYNESKTQIQIEGDPENHKLSSTIE